MTDEINATVTKEESVSAMADKLVSKLDGYDGMKKIKICFVCTGNTCRSPMAAAVFNNAVQKEGLVPHIKNASCDAGCVAKCEENVIFVAVSAGIAPYAGEPISRGAIHALEEAGIEASAENDYKNHRSAQIDEKTMRECGLIVGIGARHAMALISAFPEFTNKIISMPTDIPDPYGGDFAVYSACLEKIRLGIKELFS